MKQNLNFNLNYNFTNFNLFNLNLFNLLNFNLFILILLLSCLYTPLGYAAANSNILPQQDNRENKENQEKDLPLADLQRFTTVVEHIKNYYVNPVGDSSLFESAVRGMLAGLDPHSAYLDQEEFTDLKVSTSGKFGGLGIEVTLEDGFIRIISPIDGTPAERAGILAGDLIVRLNDTAVKGLSLKEAVEIMRGKPGEEINLFIIRDKIPKPLKIKVVRDTIVVQSVRSKLIEDKFGYIRVSQFQNDSGDELNREIDSLQKQTKKKLAGLILDLRNNPGGVLDSSVQIASSFLDKKNLKHDGLIVFTKGRLTSSQIKEKAKSKDLLRGAPLVVLVNEGSASASEIVAGALQDHKRAVVVGTKTFGKGSVQTILPLKDNHGLKLTTALYYTPAGRSIQATGITPDIIVNNIKIPAPDKEAADQLWIKEADLQGHLESKTKEKTESDLSTKKDSKDLPLIYSDYQLHEAVNTLKTLQFRA